MKTITLLIPCYNEEQTLPLLYPQLCAMMAEAGPYDWQLLFVDDGSTDHTLAVIKELRSKDGRVCYVSLSRNFGKESAMLAGFDYSRGDALIIMDADLQHPPSLAPQMLRLWEQGFQDVYARRTTRGHESWLRRNLSLAFYRLMQHLSKVEFLYNVGDFRLLDRRCVDALRELRETQRFTKGLFSWIGFRKTEICFEQRNRVAGHSSWSMRSLFALAIEGITSFSIAPLRISTVVGLLAALSAIVYMIVVLVKTLLYGDPVAGYPTLIIVILFLGGMQLFSLGIIGEYLGRVFNETKHRPVYIINEQEGV